MLACQQRLQTFLDRAFSPAERDRSFAVGACGLLIAMGVYWRFRDLAYPPYFTFDEHHFVENARNYLLGRQDWNDHPPVGKLLMIPGILVFGDMGLGWRIHAAILGVIHVYLVGRVARSLFGDLRTGLLAAAFVAVDGIFIAYSRTALLDIPMNVFMMMSLLLMVEARGPLWLLAAAVALGLAVSVKWIAVPMILVFPLLLRRRGLSIFHVAWMGAVMVAVYAVIWWLHLVITHQPATLAVLLHKNMALLRSHAGATDWNNPADSRWYTWFWLYKPILLHSAKLPNGYVRATSTIGNLLLWYATTAVWALTLVDLGRAAWRRARHGIAVSEIVRSQALLLALAVVLILQWIVTRRESYIWHYAGSYSLGLMLLAERITRLWRRNALAAAAVLVLVGLVAVLYMPLWLNDCITNTEMYLKLFVPTWR